MLRSRVLLCTAAVVLLMLPNVVLANTTGISPGGSIVFSYQIYTTYETPNGNVTNIENNQFTVNILSVNQSAPHGEVGYTVSISEFNNTVETNSSVTAPSPENFTTVFNPYDNFSYLGNIGFWPFTYTDLKNGSVTNLPVHTSVTNVPYENVTGTVNSVQHFNVTVTRSAGLIDVNLRQVAFAGSHATYYVTQFNATTGVLKYSKEITNLIGDIEKIFTYTLVSYNLPTSLNLWFLPYLAVAVVAVLAVLYVTRRKPAREKKAARMRERFR
jgi:hypothetical protein